MRYRLGLLFSLFCLTALLVLSPGPAAAQPVTITLAGTPPWTVQADSVTALQEEKLILADGNVRFVRGSESIRGESARYHEETKTLEIQGDVVVVTPDFKVVCQRLVANLEHNVGKIYNGTAYFPENNYYVSGDEIERTGPETFYLIQGRATTCDGPNPAWTLTGRNIRVRVEGYATAEHATLSSRYFPLLYVPWIKLPVKGQRQTGLLMPSISSSTRDGLKVTVPFYWAVSDSKDMTIYLTHMSRRGLETTLEARYHDWGGKGTYRVSYLRDQNPPLIAEPDMVRPVQRESRYWIRGMSNLDTDSGFHVTFDLDLVSDPSYLVEFEDLPTGFQANKEQFLEEFGRMFAGARDILRHSNLHVTKVVNNQTFRFSLEYTDDLRDPENMETIQRLPRLTLDLARQTIPGTPLYFSNNAEYIYFARKTDNTSTLKEVGHRLDVHPRLFWPLRLSRFLDLEPSVGWRETLYYPHGLEPVATDPYALDRNYRLETRELFDFVLESSTSLTRIYDLSWGPISKIKHRVKPEIIFSYIPARYQEHLPYWDSRDRIAEKREISYGLVNYLVAKVQKERGLSAAGAPPGGEPEHEYREFLRLGLHRTFDYVEEERALETRKPGVPADFRRPHGPWEFDLELDLTPWFWARARSQLDTYAEIFTEHDLELKAWDERGDYISLQYEMHLEPFRLTDRAGYEYEELRGQLHLVLNEEWALEFETRHSFLDERDIETMYAVSYTPQCWGLRLEYRDRPGDKTIAVYLSLLGLGEISGQGRVEAPEAEEAEGGSSF
ncbi:MAG: LPS assembly protein LptD [Thermodesulfobacteriota bacterium]